MDPRLDPRLFRITPSGWVGLIAAAFAVLVLPEIAGRFWLSVYTSTACFTLAIAGVAFLYARLGMVSLTQVGLMGVGGWVALRLNYAFALPFEVNMALAALVTMICGWLLALPALRMRGLYLALVTLMAAGGLEIAFATFQFPNGGDGFWGVRTGSGALFRRPWLAQSPENYLRFVIVVVVLGFLFMDLHRRLQPGRAWALIRRSEAAAMNAVAAGVAGTRPARRGFPGHARGCRTTRSRCRRPVTAGPPHGCPGAGRGAVVVWLLRPPTPM